MADSIDNQWFIDASGEIVGSTTTDTITVTWGEAGTGTLTLIQTNNQTDCVDSVKQDIIINLLPEPHIEGLRSVCELNIYYYYTNTPEGVENKETVN